MLSRRSFMKAGLFATVGTATPLRSASLSRRAQAFHERLLIFDGHVHALDREFYHGGSMGELSSEGQWDLTRAKGGGEKAFFLSIFVPEEYYPARFETKQALRRIDHAHQQLEINREKAALARNAAEVRSLVASGKMAAVLDIEGSYDLDGDLGVLREFHARGLRSAQLSAHNWNQHYAGSCCVSTPDVELSESGRRLLREMNRLGMVINVSHSGDKTMEQAIEWSDHPVIATHHGLRRVNNIPRNMPDRLLEKLAARGGVVGIQIGSEFSYPKEYAWITEHRRKTFWDTTDVPTRVAGKTIYEVDEIVAPQFPMLGATVPDDVRMGIENWVDVVDKVVALVGEDHVALGSDFDGGPTLAREMRDVRDLPVITECMLQRGYTEQRIAKFWGRNLLRVFGEITGG